MAKNISLPGMTVHLIEGPEGTANDMPFIENLYVSGNERRILENLQKGRVRNVRLIIRRICGLYSANDFLRKNEGDMYIHQTENWPNFTWDQTRISLKLAKVNKAAGFLEGRLSAFGFDV